MSTGTTSAIYLLAHMKMGELLYLTVLKGERQGIVSSTTENDTAEL
ncbi:hypothetical protein MUP01_03305 [Candidatus Bathyarchaeota archaeon]|nr:hypothetical protein [Candidatus Bathyarchaeota archaeon]